MPEGSCVELAVPDIDGDALCDGVLDIDAVPVCEGVPVCEDVPDCEDVLDCEGDLDCVGVDELVVTPIVSTGFVSAEKARPMATRVFLPAAVLARPR